VELTGVVRRVACGVIADVKTVGVGVGAGKAHPPIKRKENRRRNIRLFLPTMMNSTQFFKRRPSLTVGP